MPNAKTSKTQTKAHFVRSQPSTMSAAEVVEKGKAAEIAVSTHYVHKVRAQAKVKAKANKVSKSGKSTKPRTPNKKTTTKAAFVRANAMLSPQEIVAKAKATGIKLETSYVYNVRGADRAATKKKRKAAKVTSSATTSANGARVSVNPNADLLKAVAAEIGLGNAIEILSVERARLAAVIAR
jgi:hypothetical protein